MRNFVLALVVALISGCSLSPKNEKQSAKTDDVYIMTYNVENLFDAEHDEGKDDYAFLPASKKKKKFHQKFCSEVKVKEWREECLYKDWTEEKLKEKMKRLAETIFQFNSGKGPDVLFLSEVENRGVLEKMNKDFLGGVYKEVILIEGDDKRGIDVAIMSKLPLHRPPILHKIPFKFDDPKRAQDTRGILQADLVLPDGALMTVFGLHLPNPAHPKDLRTQALDFLNRLAKSSEGSHYVVAAGDFNITSEENVAQRRTEEMSKTWMVSHAVGCKSCTGTYYYHPKQNWSFLDWMLFSKNLEPGGQGWYLDKDSIQVLKSSGRQVDKEGYPQGFEDAKNPLGVSDHLPMGAILRKAK